MAKGCGAGVGRFTEKEAREGIVSVRGAVRVYNLELRACSRTLVVWKSSFESVSSSLQACFKKIAVTTSASASTLVSINIASSSTPPLLLLLPADTAATPLLEISQS